MQRTVLLGAGYSRAKKIATTDEPDWVGELITVDMNPASNPSILWDLDEHPLPFEDSSADEIHAYDCLEHLGRQGDWKGWLKECADYHRILKPGGKLCVLVPIGADALADPGHTRFFSANWFGFLCEEFYERNLAAGAPVTDYRWAFDYRFKMVFCEEQGGHHLAVILEKA